MNIDNFLKDNLVILDQEFKTKEEALKFLADHLVANNYAQNADKVLELALKREAEFSTGIGGKIAIPHIRDEVMNESVITFARVKPLDWQSLDQQPVEYIFFISLKPGDAQNEHMEIIAQLSSLFLDENFVNQLANVNDKQSLVNLINQNNQEKEVEASQSDAADQNYDIVAVTACPTGIAHTFMARDILIKTAKEMNIKIKVETQGADGTKNQLSQEEINNAKGVIIAVDRTIDLNRFKGHKNFLEMGTKAVIKNAKKEITRSLNGEGMHFKGVAKEADKSQTVDQISFENFGKRMYKSLMTGVSYMLPFVVFGGILIAIAFLIDIQNAGDNNYGTVLPVAKWFKSLGGLAFGLMTSVLCAGITYAIVGRQGILPGIIVGQIASGSFLMKLDPETGTVDWLSPPGINNPVSGVFGAVIGAFIAASLLIVLIKYVFSYLPAVLSGIKNILLIPLFGTFLIAVVFWVVNIPIIYLNYGFTLFLETMEGKPYLSWLLGLIIGAMMAIDLGGPINKAAYVFGTTSLNAAGGSGTISMAAAMAAGMVPPIAIALSTTFFKKIWTADERKSGIINYVMGLTFISEGAIPFTVAKPKVMVPSNIIAGAVTGLLIGALGVSIAAPHGGILTIALAKSDVYGLITDSGAQIGLGVALFILAIIGGSIAGMFSIYLLNWIFNKKNKNSNSGSNEGSNEVKKENQANQKANVNLAAQTLEKDFGSTKTNYKRKLNYDLYNHIFAFNRLCY